MTTKRAKARIQEEENEKVDTYFAGLIQRFHRDLFNADFDDPKFVNINIFSLYDKAWRSYAREWNIKRGRTIMLDLEAFSDYAIKQTIYEDEQ